MVVWRGGVRGVELGVGWGKGEEVGVPGDGVVVFNGVGGGVLQVGWDVAVAGEGVVRSHRVRGGVDRVVNANVNGVPVGVVEDGTHA